MQEWRLKYSEVPRHKIKKFKIPSSKVTRTKNVENIKVILHWNCGNTSCTVKLKQPCLNWTITLLWTTSAWSISQPYHKCNTHIKFIGVPENARSVGLMTPEVKWASSSTSIPTAGASYTPTPIIVNVTSISRSCSIRQSAVGTHGWSPRRHPS